MNRSLVAIKRVAQVSAMRPVALVRDFRKLFLRAPPHRLSLQARPFSAYKSDDHKSHDDHGHDDHPHPVFDLPFNPYGT
jgi:hypothetical protein